MHEVDLKSIDLNLLVALEALLQEQSVTRAAQRVGRSQPAMSRALGRLRQTFDDPLMVVSGRGLELTPRAIELLERLAPVLGGIQDLLERPEFDPTTANLEFRISAPEGAIYVLLSEFLVRTASEAPHMNFTIVSAAARHLDALQSGDIDLAVDTFVDAPVGFNRQSLFENRLVCVVRRDHPVLQHSFDVNAFIQWPHIWIDSATSRALDLELERKGIQRRCTVQITSFLTGASLAASTDCIMVLPELVASRACEQSPLVVLPIPMKLRRITLDQLWHPRRHHDPTHIWLRSMIYETARALEKRSQLKTE